MQRVGVGVGSRAEGAVALRWVTSRQVQAFATSAAAVPPAAGRRVEIYSYDARKGVDILAQYTGSAHSSDDVVRVAYENALKVLAYYQREFGRDSFDGRGTVLKVRVHAPDAQTGAVPANNAYWFNDEKRLWFGDGDGSLFSPLGYALDVYAHEFTHGVVDSEVKLDYIGQQGGLHESFADVLSTGIDGNFTVGEDVYTPGIPGDSLRDMAHPTYDNARTLPAWVDEPHDLASIPNYAAYKVAQAIGGTQMRKIWYSALTDHLKSHSGYSGAMKATLAAAAQLYGNGSSQYAAVRDAWEAVGVDAKTPAMRELSKAERFDLGASMSKNLIPTGR